MPGNRIRLAYALGVKRALLVVAIAAILIVLISPLPELDAAVTVRSTLLPIVFELCWVLFLAFFVLSHSLAGLRPLLQADDILKKTCARLC